MPTVSTYLDRAELEKLKRFCERRKMKPYRAIRMLILKGMVGIEQGAIRDEEGLGGNSGNVGETVSESGEEPRRDWKQLFKPEPVNQRKRGEK